jgi:diacylglycerol kinase
VAEGEREGGVNEVQSRVEAFKNALNGGKLLLLTQPHARIHALAALGVSCLGFVCGVTAIEWALLILSMTLVWVTEALNTGLEFLADEVSLDWRERIKHAKDVSAFAVLIAAIGAAMIGALIFVPYILRFFKVTDP